MADDGEVGTSQTGSKPQKRGGGLYCIVEERGKNRKELSTSTD
jgi:hypothetical protein